MGIRHVAIVSLPVADQARAKAFWCDQVGFEVRRDNPMGPERRWVEVAPVGGGTSFTLVTWFDDMPPGSVQGIVLESDGVAADHARLRERGVEVSEIDSAPWGTFATFRDPDGNGFVLQETAPDA